MYFISHQVQHNTAITMKTQTNTSNALTFRLLAERSQQLESADNQAMNSRLRSGDRKCMGPIGAAANPWN